MRKVEIAGVCAWALLASAAAAQPQPLPEKRLVLRSPAFADCAVIPDKYTLAVAAPVSPPLAWINPPKGTVTFAIMLHDPDSVRGKGSADFLHWIIFNIPAATTHLDENVPKTPTLPDGAEQVMAHPGVYGFSGPGAKFVYHHYTFELFALDTRLQLPPSATRDQVMAAMDGHVIGKAAFVGRFHR